MNRSLYTKLVLIILFLIISLTAVTGVFLTRGVRSFYLNEFYNRMQEVFSDEELASGLRSAAQADAPDNMAEVLGAYTGRLGIDTGTRNYHILSGETGAWLAGSVTPENGVAITPNIISAIAGALVDNLPALIESGVGIVMELLNGLISALPQLTLDLFPGILWGIYPVQSQF